MNSSALGLVGGLNIARLYCIDRYLGRYLPYSYSALSGSVAGVAECQGYDRGGRGGVEG